VLLDLAGTLHLRDRVQGSVMDWTTRLLLHPDVAVEEASGRLLLTTPAGGCRLVHTGGVLRIEEATWHPGFGEDVPTHALHIQSTGGDPVHMEISPFPA